MLIKIRTHKMANEFKKANMLIHESRAFAGSYSEAHCKIMVIGLWVCAFFKSKVSLFALTLFV